MQLIQPLQKIPLQLAKLLEKKSDIADTGIYLVYKPLRLLYGLSFPRLLAQT